MNDAIFWIGRGAFASGLLSLGVLVWLSFGHADAPGRRRWRQYVAFWDKRLEFLHVSMTGRRVAVLQLCASALFAALGLASGRLLVVAIVPVIWVVPALVLRRRVDERRIRFDAQIESWLGATSNALKASSSLGEAFAAAVPLVPSPMSQELDLLVKEHELGTPLDRALDNLAERMQTSTTRATVVALKVARRSGGNLADVLDTAAASLRELARLDGVVRTKTAEGRAQAWVIGALPVPMILGLRAIDPAFFEPLFKYFTGHLLLGIAGALWLCAVVIAKKVLEVDV